MINGSDKSYKNNLLQKSTKHLKLDSLNLEEHLENFKEAAKKNLHTDFSKKLNLISPKKFTTHLNNHSSFNGLNFNSINLNDHEKFSQSTNKQDFTKFEKFSQAEKNSRKKIAPLENNKNTLMNKTNKSKEYMKYINKTFYNDSLNKKNEIINSNSGIKNPTGLNHFDMVKDLSPSNMKKTINTLTYKPTSKINLNNVNNNTYSGFNNIINHNHNENFKNFINSTNNLNFNYNILNNNNNLYINTNNYLNQTTKFLFDVSNFNRFYNIENAKYATKPSGIITSFGVNTNFGNVRY